MRTRSRLSYRSTLKTAVPVKAGIHPSTTRAPEKWVPAFAGTPESGLRVYHDIVQRFAADEASAVPSVNPEQCGVISTFDSSWNEKRDGRRSGCSGLQCCHHTSSTAPPVRLPLNAS